MFFIIIVTIICIQRGLELFIAKSNEKWMKEKGAIEVGSTHYPYIVLMHVLFFISLIIEVVYFQKGLANLWWIPFALFIVAQIGRVWSLYSLGRFWNTKIIILPGAEVVAKGPYRFIRHPNYFVVALEIFTLPLIFQAYFTSIIFSVLNGFILSIRIRQEEAALGEITNYQQALEGKTRLFPSIRKK